MEEERSKQMRLSGIYAILSIATPECYIGQSVDIYRRFAEHLMYFRENRHSKNLQLPWNKYGEDNFKFLVLEICEDDYKALTTQENFWINRIGTYNRTLPPDAAKYPTWKKTARLLLNKSSLMKLPEIQKEQLLY